VIARHLAPKLLVGQTTLPGIYPIIAGSSKSSQCRCAKLDLLRTHFLSEGDTRGRFGFGIAYRFH
jgi:hypothetical protein